MIAAWRDEAYNVGDRMASGLRALIRVRSALYVVRKLASIYVWLEQLGREHRALDVVEIHTLRSHWEGRY